MNEKQLYEWALKKFGDDADSMSADQIREAYNKENPTNATPAPGSSLEKSLTEGAGLTEKEQDAAARAGISVENNGMADLDEKGLREGPGGIKFDPYKEQVVYNQSTNGWERYPLGELPAGYASVEEMNRLANDPSTPEDHWAKQNQKALSRWSNLGQQGTTSVDTKGNEAGPEVAPKQEEAKPAPSNTRVDWNSAPKADTSTQSIDPKGRYKLKSIWDAYHDGEIDENTRDYMTIDALSKGLRGFSKDIANVGAAYSGGTIQDSAPEQSLWSKRNEEMAKSAIESEKAGVSGSREQREYDTWAANQVARKFNNAALGQKQEMASIVRKLAEKAPNDTVRLAYLNVANKMLSNGTMDEKDFAVTGAGELWNKLSELFN